MQDVKVIRELLPADPLEQGFKEQPAGDGLEYEFDSAAQKLQVVCSVVKVDGRRWLCLCISRYPQPLGFADVTFVRKAFFGRALPALIIFEPDEPAMPLGDQKIRLWTPLDEAPLPLGTSRRCS